MSSTFANGTTMKFEARGEEACEQHACRRNRKRYTGPRTREESASRSPTAPSSIRWSTQRREAAEHHASLKEYTGPMGEERLVSATFANGTTMKFDGRGEEKLVSGTRPDGTVERYTGPKDQERKVSVTFDGTIFRYGGPRNEEKLLSVTRPDGTVEEHTGPKGGSERLSVLKRELGSRGASPAARGDWHVGHLDGLSERFKRDT